MKFKILILLIIVFSVSCAPEDPGASDSGDEPVVLVEVDGQEVTLPMLERVMASRGVDEDDHEAMRELLDELIRVQVVANAARSEGLADDAEVVADLRLAESQLLYRHFLDDAQRDTPVSDEDVRAVYDRQLERSGDTQYRIEIIGFEDPARAESAIERLRAGEVEWASLRSEAESAGRPVDEPGWIDRSQVPEGFSALLADIRTGEVVPQPLEDSRGWFLVQVVETRPLQVPSFDEVRDGIARSLLQQRREALIDSLYDQAEITPMLPLDETGSEGEEQ